MFAARLLPLLWCCLLAPPSLHAAEDPAAAREQALDNLLSERESPEALAKVVAEARRAGVAEQAILEARFLYHVDRRDDPAIAAMLPEFIKQRASFRLADSAIFAVEEDWLAVLEYVHAIERARNNDREGFKKHITEAFWLSPRQASAFAPHVERMRLDDRMREVRVDFSSRFSRLAGGDAVALSDLLEDRKAVLLHFWSPWSQECTDSLPDFTTLATTLAPSAIGVVSIIPEAPPKMVEDARSMISKLGAKAPGDWLVDRKDDPFLALLRVQMFPRMVLVARDGRVLFNGEPGDSGFWQNLLEIDPRVIRPASPGAKEE